jgi:hypothetical protein
LKAARRIDIFASLRDRYTHQSSYQAEVTSSARPFDIEATENEKLTAGILELLDCHDDALSGNYGYPVPSRSQQYILDDGRRLRSRFSSSSGDEVYDGIKTGQDEFDQTLTMTDFDSEKASDGNQMQVQSDGLGTEQDEIEHMSNLTETHNKRVSTRDDMQANHSGPKTEQDEIEQMLSLIDKHNKKVTAKNATHSEYTIEHYLLNNDMAKERLSEHIEILVQNISSSGKDLGA